MKGIRYILILLTLCVAIGSCEREDGQGNLVQESARLIQFSAESEWQGITKAAIGSLNDLKNDGFVVWANWTKDPNDKSNYAGENERAAFGLSGTRVNASDDGDNTFQPNQDADDKWVCEEEQEWSRGYYNFAAVLPASAFGTNAQINQGSLTSSFKKTKAEDGSTSTEYSSLITLDLNESGFDLSRNQIDLMYAFHNEDNSAETASVVNLDFLHAFSLINLQLSYGNVKPSVNRVTLYGIHNTISGDLKYRKDVSINGETVNEVYSNNLAELLSVGNCTTQQNPYKIYVFSQTDLDPTGSHIIDIAKNLLVFPETLSEQCALRIEIDCVMYGRQRTIYAEVNSGSWKPGETYTYKLDVANVTP